MGEAQIAYHEQSSAELEGQLARCSALECNMSARASEWQHRAAAFESEVAAAERAANSNRVASEERLRLAQQQADVMRSKAVDVAEERDQARREFVDLNQSEAAALAKAQAELRQACAQHATDRRTALERAQAAGTALRIADSR